MRRFPGLAVSIIGAAALSGSLLTNALASQPSPFQSNIRTQDKKYAVNGSLTVSGVLRVNKNNSVYGKLYAHGGEQVWKGLLVRSGLTTDGLAVTGPNPATFSGGATVKGTLTADAITDNGAFTTTGKITSVGLDAGTGDISAHNVTATGSLSTGSLSIGGTTLNVSNGALSFGGDVTASSLHAGSTTIGTSGLTTNSITDNGNFTATGTLSAGATTVTSLTATGNVDFSRATVTGLNLGGLGSTFSSLNIGGNGATQSPLTILENNQSAQIGVNSSGALTVPALAVTNTSGTGLSVAGNTSIVGNLAVGGSGGITTSAIASPIASGQTTGGTLAITGNPINLAGTTQLTAGSDLSLSANTSSTPGQASHIIGANDTDVVGAFQVTEQPSAGLGTEVTFTRTFIKPYATIPAVMLTPLSDPQPGVNVAPKVWVTVNTGGTNGNQYTGFTVHYANTAVVGVNGASVTFAYHVIGS